MWNTYRVTDAFEPGKPWLLRFFDQIKFFPVSSEELRDFRDGFLEGQRQLDIIPTRFRVRDYLAFVDANAEQTASFKSHQQAAFDAERARWKMTADEENGPAAEDAADREADGVLPPGATAIESPVPGSVWKILVEPGCEVSEGEALIIVESMKMEIVVCAPLSGLVAEIRCAEGRDVQLGQPLVIMAPPVA
jgi:urea carboxylase